MPGDWIERKNREKWRICMVEEFSHGTRRKENLLFEEETYAVRCALFEVYKEFGCGFLEPVYQVG